MRSVSLTRLIGTASFRLAAIYLAIFSVSVALLGVVVYFSVGHEILAQIDERLIEESAKLRSDFQRNGIAHLAEVIRARLGAAGSLDYRLEDSAGRALAGALAPAADGQYREGWIKFVKTEEDEDGPDSDWERALVTKLGDGSVLVVGDELDGVEEARRAVLIAFGWALGATILVGASGGLLLGAAFLRRIDAMTGTAQEIIAGDLSRRIPTSTGDADLARLARTFNTMLDRIGALLDANKHVSIAIAHDLRSPLGRVLRRLEAAHAGPPNLARYEEAIEAGGDGSVPACGVQEHAHLGRHVRVAVGDPEYSALRQRDDCSARTVSVGDGKPDGGRRHSWNLRPEGLDLLSDVVFLFGGHESPLLSIEVDN